MRLRRLAGRLRPRSFAARIALTGVVTLGIALVVFQLVINAVVRGQVREAAEHTLRDQAAQLAMAVRRAGPAGAADVWAYLPGTSGEVRVQGELVAYGGAPERPHDVTVSVIDGPVQVTLARDTGLSAVARWIVPMLLAAGFVVVAAAIWLLSARLARRLRAEVGHLAEQAEAVATGDLSVRAVETEDELGRLGRAFNRMIGRLEAADLRPREFLADVAHELRTPVTAIEGFAQALSDGTAQSVEDRSEAADFIREEAERLRGLIIDLQELTWLDLSPPVACEQVDLAEVARQGVARLGPEAASRGVELVADAPFPVRAIADPGHCETIVANLVTNALRATPAGGRVAVLVDREGDRAVLAVTDTGHGIAEQHLPYVFDRLYRVQEARNREDGGSGLGLPIVRRLVTLMEGRVSVRSTVGTGTTFTVSLPAAPLPRPDRGQGSGRAAGSGRLPAGPTRA